MYNDTSLVLRRRPIIMNKKVKKKNILIVLTFIILLFVPIYYFIFRDKGISLKEDNFYFSYTESVPTNADYYFKGVDKEKTLDLSDYVFSTIGSFEIEVTLEEELFYFNIVIVDDIAPTIVFNSDDIITVNNRDAANFYSIVDISEVTITKGIDWINLKNGENEICIEAKDAYQNKSETCATFQLQIDQAFIEAHHYYTSNSLETVIEDLKIV